MKEYTVRVYDDGTIKWYNNKGMFHREDGPAVIHADGTEYWYRNGKLYRENGPSIVDIYGSKYWYLNNKLHRVDGPAVIWSDGSEFWFRDGKRVDEKDVLMRHTIIINKKTSTIKKIVDSFKKWVKNKLLKIVQKCV